MLGTSSWICASKPGATSYPQKQRIKERRKTDGKGKQDLVAVDPSAKKKKKKKLNFLWVEFGKSDRSVNRKVRSPKIRCQTAQTKNEKRNRSASKRSRTHAEKSNVSGCAPSSRQSACHPPSRSPGRVAWTLVWELRI